MRTSVSIILAALILAGTFAWLFRYEPVYGPEGLPMRLDRWTGDVVMCATKVGTGQINIGCPSSATVVSETPPAQTVVSKTPTKP